MINFSENRDIFRTCDKKLRKLYRSQSKFGKLFHLFLECILKNIYLWKKIKSIGNISESNLINDKSFIIFFMTILALPAATPVTAGKLWCAHPVSMKDRPAYPPVQIAGCASTDHRMR